MSEKYIKIGKDVEVTNQDIDDIMATALEGGITYWCDRAVVVGDYYGEYASEQISRGGILLLNDFEEECVYELNKGILLMGLEHYLNDPDKPYDIIEDTTDEKRIDTCMVDGVVADMIIQYAIFGEVIYA